MSNMKLAEVAEYVELRTGVLRSRATIYNWATKGVSIAGEKVKLQTEMHAGQMFTRELWVDAFLARVDQR